MNKTQKRQLNLRNKLMAAVAMLLVSSIMMVSTTYAWFTLSTAPEVQGITTTVGTNGNLEIALSPLSGETGTIGTNVGDSLNNWLTKNTTWGNLLDLSHAEYELDKVVLQPSQMAFKTGESGGYAVDNAGLAYPVYGSDGRISKLDKGSSIGVKQTAAAGTNRTLSEGFQLSGTGYGVRAVGTSSGQTENERVFASGLSALRNGINQAAGVASSAMNDNGQALANMMVDHAMVGKFGGTEDFTQYEDELNALVTSLEKSVENMDAALKGFLTAYVATQKTGTDLSVAVTAIESATDISTLIGTYGGSNAELSAALTARNDIAAKVASARLAFNSIEEWNWNGVAGVVNQLMNVDKVTINDLTYAQITGSGEEDGIGQLVQSIMGNNSTATIKLNEGSGIYYDIHKMSSKIYASTKMAVDAGKVMSGMGVIPVNTIIETTYNGTTILGAAQAVVSGLTPKEEDASAGSTSVSKLDVYYGYILDFVFRTNAADSDLLLQTEAANRVYTDGGEATMGAGSTISFQVPTGVNDGIVKGMLDGIRVVFFNTVDGTVYGVAKATSATAEVNDLGTTWTGKLQLCDYNVSDVGLVTVGEAKNSAALCDLNQNQPQRVSVMVSLDGNDITNVDILAEGNLTGTLNLQFASSATLVPMVNTDLKTMESYDVKLGGTKIGTVEQNGTFTYKLDPAKVESVTVTLGDTAVTGAYDEETGVITITNATGEVNISVVQKVPATTATPESSNGEATTEPTTAPAQGG